MSFFISCIFFLCFLFFYIYSFIYLFIKILSCSLFFLFLIMYFSLDAFSSSTLYIFTHILVISLICVWYLSYLVINIFILMFTSPFTIFNFVFSHFFLILVDIFIAPALLLLCRSSIPLHYFPFCLCFICLLQIPPCLFVSSKV